MPHNSFPNNYSIKFAYGSSNNHKMTISFLIFLKSISSIFHKVLCCAKTVVIKNLSKNYGIFSVLNNTKKLSKPTICISSDLEKLSQTITRNSRVISQSGIFVMSAFFMYLLCILTGNACLVLRLY